MAKAKRAGKKADAPAEPAPIADVSHPDSSAPSDTSRPIITHRPIMKDPMVVAASGTAEGGKDADSEMETAAKSFVSQHTSETKLTPPSEADGAPKADKTDDAAAAEEASSAVQNDESPDSEAGTSENEKPDEEVAADPKKAEKTADAKAKHANPDLETAVQAEQDAKVHKLIESKKYFLPINAAEQRRSARVVAIGVVVALVLAVAWVDVALDAGLIHLGSIKPVTHLFSN